MTAPTPLVALVCFLAFLGIIRVAELVVSARHVRILRSRGAIEHGRGHFPLFVVLHALFPVLLAVEVLFLGARPPTTWPLWLAVFLAGAALRVATMRALGVHWTVTVWVVPGMARIRSGPYRWFGHPNYVAVTAELAAGPLIFGAWRTALVVSLINVVALTIRLRVEERALRDAAA